ncbi:retrovirus-related pol polyprotein from transposon TNT 1-94, partial [Tanacetum coccineum]
YVLNYVNDINSRADNQNANVSNIANQKKHKAKVKKSKKLGSKERLASPRPRKPRTCLRWSPTRRTFDLSGKVIQSSDSECQSDISESDNACASNHQEPTSKRFPNSTSFLGRTVLFGNDHVAVILDLDVAFKRNTYYVRNFERVNLLKGNRTTNLYTINLHEMAFTSPICLMARATSTKSWLWHQRLSHLNFDIINDLAKNDLVTSLPKFKSKDEAQEEIKTFLKKIQVLLQAHSSFEEQTTEQNSQIKCLRLTLKVLASLTKRRQLELLSRMELLNEETRR